ncbi:MAG: GNAT family N-acetyltransferase [Saprospiraceae bacterium]|nr:GNAT family N-acetyltransferase [Saprospiraceae bacterium]
MKVKKLGDITFELIIDCFLKSFENYYVEVPSDKNYYKKRWEIAKVDFTLSYGMFDGENIVGFIIHAIDNRHGKKIAFNTGTGVIPEYRGKRIVQAIYDFAIPDLKMNGITQCALEVIIENHKAIKSYQRVGFEICKTYNCFSGAIPLSTNEEIELQRVGYNDFDWEKLPNQDLYSWDFNSKVIKNGDYEYYQLIRKGIVESYFVINPNNKYLAQFDVLEKNEGCWHRLFKGIKSISNTIRIINIDTRLTHKIDFVHSIGLSNTVNQYEMNMNI